MKLIKYLLPILCVLPLCNASAAKLNKIPVDPEVRIGTLPNGLTYYIRHNEWPADRADFYIAYRVGSVNEEENQRGLAHFLEHMCFNGTKHFPGNSLISYLESIGVKFGANLNAYTSTDETVYNICDVPTTRTTSLDSCLLILRDWSHDLTLADADIDAERGVIKGEWRQRNGQANTRMLEKAAPIIYDTSLYGQRMPIGLMEIVENFPYDDLRNYYHRWYYPENQCVIVVGDVDVDAIESTIKQLWADVERPSFDVTPPTVEVPDNEEIIATVQTDPEQVSSVVQLYLKHSDIADEDINTIAELRYDVARSLVLTMLAERLDDLEHSTGTLLSNTAIGDRNFLLARTRQAMMLRGIAATGREAEAVSALSSELKRAAIHGFTPVELQRAKLDYRSGLDSEFTSRNKVTNTRYAKTYVRHYLDGGALPAAEPYYKMMKGVLSQITLDDVNAYIRDVVSTDSDRNVVLIAYLPNGSTMTDSELAAAYSSVDTASLTPYEAPDLSMPLLSDLPVAGSIVAESTDDKFGTTTWTLSNGIKMHLRQSDTAPDQVIIAGYSPGGFSANYDNALAPEYRLVNEALAISSFGGHPTSELRRLTAGKKARVDISIDNMEERIAASTSPSDMETAFQLIYLKATSAMPDTTAYNTLIETKRLKFNSNGVNPTFVMGDSIHANVYGHHPLGEKLQLADLDAADYGRILALYRQRFGDMSDFDFYVLGNFDVDSLRTMAERYIATLPAAGRMEKANDIGYRYAKGRERRRFTCPMETPQTIAYTFYNVPCEYNLTNVVKSHTIGNLLQSKLLADLREARGWTYGIKTHGGISAGMNGDDPANFMMPVYIRVAPENADSTFSIVAETVDRLADPDFITDEELDKIKQNMVKNYDQSNTDNTYWLTVMHMNDKFGRDMHSGYKEIVASLTCESIADFARQYLLNANRMMLEMSPAE